MRTLECKDICGYLPHELKGLIMDKFEEAAIKYDMDKAFMLDYYLGEYNRMKNKISDNNPYLLRLKRNIKELRKKTI